MTAYADPETVYIAAYDTLADWECGLAIAHINKAAYQIAPGRYRIATVGADMHPITTSGGQCILPDVTIADVDPASAAMLILPGSDAYADGGDEWAGLAARFLTVGTPVAAICGATMALARSGLLDDRPHTSNALAALQTQPGYRGGRHYVGQPAVTDGDLITGSGVAPAHFAREILARLDVYRPEVLDAWFALYGHNDPAGYHRLMELTS